MGYNLKLLCEISDRDRFLVMLNEYYLIETYEIEGKQYFNLAIEECFDIEQKLDEEYKLTNTFRYMLHDFNESPDYFYRAYINKRGEKKVTQKATKYIGLI